MPSALRKRPGIPACAAGPYPSMPTQPGRERATTASAGLRYRVVGGSGR